MNTVTLRLSTDTERKLRDRAGQLGQTLETYLQQIAEKAVENGKGSEPSQEQPIRCTLIASEKEGFPKFISRPKLTGDELERLLYQFSSGSTGKILPDDFSRADIYDDQD